MKNVIKIVLISMLLAGQAFAEEEGFWSKMSKGHSGGANAGGGVVGAAIVLGTLGVRAVAYSLSDKNATLEDVNKDELTTLRDIHTKKMGAWSRAMTARDDKKNELEKETNSDKKNLLQTDLDKLEESVIITSKEELAADAAVNNYKKTQEK